MQTIRKVDPERIKPLATTDILYQIPAILKC